MSVSECVWGCGGVRTEHLSRLSDSVNAIHGLSVGTWILYEEENKEKETCREVGV